MATKGKQRRADEIDAFIGQRIRAARITANLSQTELADAIGITFQQVQKYEKGVNRVSGSRMVRIAQALKRPIAWFSDSAPGTTTTKLPDDPLLALGQTRRGVNLARLFITLTAEQQDAVLTVVETYIPKQLRKAA